MPKNVAAFTLSLIAIILGSNGEAHAWQNVVVGRAVASRSQVSMDQIDHAPWDRLLQKYVDDQGQVDYKSWHSSSRDTQAIDGYLAALSSASPSTRATRNAKMAFWINAYNAVTIKGILKEYPTTSIRNHTAKLFGYNIWKNLLLVVGDTKISLNDIEHKVLRKMGEPRVHFAIVCASHSCPRLLKHAYTAESLDRQMTENTKNFFANKENFQFDTARKQFRLSSILSWFAEDFGANQSAQLKTISPYLPSQSASNAATNNSVRVSYLKYDWSLNEQKETRSNSTRTSGRR